jgi:hypothetical protein
MLDLELELGAIQQPFQLDTIKRGGADEILSEFFSADV